jgi:hypothetical protein
MLQQSIKVTLIAVSVELLFLKGKSIGLQRSLHLANSADNPYTPFIRHNYFNKDGCGLGFRVKDLRNGP